jgi:hypothetical protein
MKQPFSFGRAISALLKRGSLLDAEESFDIAVRKRIASTEALSQLRANFLPAELSFYAPVIARARRSVDAGGSGSGVVGKTDIGPYSDLLQWSATLKQGAQLLTDVVGDLSAGVSTSLPAPSWVAETEPAPDTDQTFTKLNLKPKRVSAKITVSSMLLSASPDAEALITGDLAKGLSSQLDHAVLYGTGGLQPLGIANHPDTNKVFGLDWKALSDLEALCASADIAEANFGYITSPNVRRDLKTALLSPGAGPIWEHLTNPLSSNVVDTVTVFAGCWDSCSIASWGLEIIVNPFSKAEYGQVEIVGHLFCDVGLRYPKAFGVVS